MSDPTSQEPSMAEILLSEDLKYWRVECPDEWIMDRFIKKAKSLESETASLRAQLAEANMIKDSACRSSLIAEERVRTAAKALYKVRHFDAYENDYDDPGMIAKEWFDEHGGNPVMPKQSA